MGRRSQISFDELKRRAYAFIQSFLAKNNYSPSYRQIMKGMQINSTSVVRKTLYALQDEGLLSLNPVSRSVRFPEIKIPPTLPVFLKGTISAGQGVVIPESGFTATDSESIVEIPSNLLPSGLDMTRVMALKVQGDSMEEDGVLDGDIVILQATDSWSDHDMVAVWQTKKESATLKRILSLPSGNKKLLPSNRRYIPWVVGKNEYIVQGRVFAVLRNCWKKID